MHCRCEKTGSPGIIYIGHQVLRHESEHGTCSSCKHWRANAHIAKLNELTKSELTDWSTSTVDEAALAILKREGSPVITIVSSLRKFIVDIDF